MKKARQRREEAVARLAIETASYALGVGVPEIEGDGRGAARAAFARHVAMYLAHVCFELSLARVARAFDRDRSTVASACRKIEDRRDDPTFDATMQVLEDMLRGAPPPRDMLAKAS